MHLTRTSEQVLQHHAKPARDANLEKIVADYTDETDESARIASARKYRGREEIHSFFADPLSVLLNAHCSASTRLEEDLLFVR
jgi:hypothetical protein